MQPGRAPDLLGARDFASVAELVISSASPGEDQTDALAGRGDHQHLRKKPPSEWDGRGRPIRRREAKPGRLDFGSRLRTVNPHHARNQRGLAAASPLVPRGQGVQLLFEFVETHPLQVKANM